MSHKGDWKKRIAVALLTLSLSAGAMVIPLPGSSVIAAPRYFTLEQALSLSLSGSEEYISLKEEIAVKRQEYSSAVQSLKLRQNANSSYSWSPMYELTLPEQTTLSEDFEYVYRPYAIQAQTASLEHQLDTLYIEMAGEVAALYSAIYSSQEIITATEEQLALLNDRLTRKEASLYTGAAGRQDKEEAQAAVTAMEEKLASLKSSFLSDEQKLSDRMGIDLTSGYLFQNPFKEDGLARSGVAYLAEYAVIGNQEVYDLALELRSKQLAMEKNYELMEQQYGEIVSPMKPYISAVENGEEINEDALANDYQNMLASIESMTEGNVRFLSVSVSKSWLTGAAGGIRYLQDEPEVLLNAILEYRKLEGDIAKAESDVRKKTSEEYDSLVQARNAYRRAVRTSQEAEETLRGLQQERIYGSISQAELEAGEDAAYEAQIMAYEAQNSYLLAQYSFDCLTCGEAGLLYEKEVRADLYDVTENYASGVYYSLAGMVQNNAFELSVYVSADFPVRVTSFELWVDGTRIGERTEVGKTLVHLSLAVGSAKNVFIRLYNGEEFIDDCPIDTDGTGGELYVLTDYKVTRNTTDKVGAFTWVKNGATGVVTICLKIDEDENVASYSVQDKNKTDILSGKRSSDKGNFSYLGLMVESIDELRLVFYDKYDREMYRAYLDSASLSVYRAEEGE